MAHAQEPTETPAPTEAPTEEPTATEEPAPTETPALSPTNEPTEEPTPTETSTEVPTPALSPTTGPTLTITPPPPLTVTPTATPALSPTTGPMATVAPIPTVLPTATPTPGPLTVLFLKAAPSRIPADERSRAVILVWAADAQGQPMMDGTQVTASTSLGTLEEAQAVTRHGAARFTLRAGKELGLAVVTVRAGEAQKEMAVELVTPVPG